MQTEKIDVDAKLAALFRLGISLNAVNEAFNHDGVVELGAGDVSKQLMDLLFAVGDEVSNGGQCQCPMSQTCYHSISSLLIDLMFEEIPELEAYRDRITAFVAKGFQPFGFATEVDQ